MLLWVRRFHECSGVAPEINTRSVQNGHAAYGVKKGKRSSDSMKQIQ
jgi:hypothetical protein